jgi:ketosteroid isomerase-like protein
MYPELSVQPDQYVEAGETVTVLGRIAGRTAPGVAFEEPFVHVWTVRHGRAVAFREFFDTAKMNSILEASSGASAQSDAVVPGQSSRSESRSVPRR